MELEREDWEKERRWEEERERGQGMEREREREIGQIGNVWMREPDIW